MRVHSSVTNRDRSASSLSAPALRPLSGRTRWAGSFAVISALLLSLTAIAWSSQAHFDRVTRASGQLIASSRIQIIQAVDGGVIRQLLVREGDRVEAGQLLARLEPGRTEAALQESEARLAGLQAAIARLRAEAKMSPMIEFDASIRAFPGVVNAQRALFEQRRSALFAEIEFLERASDLANDELAIVERLFRSGDVSEVERLRALKLAHDARAQPDLRRKRVLQDVSAELARAEEELAQVEQVRAQRRQLLDSLELRATSAGIVKNIRLTTPGAVLRPGEELLQIVPVDDRLIVEAKVRPADIGDLRPGLPVSIKFDAWDYTVYGMVPGRLAYISADTVRDEARTSETAHYRVHVETEITSGGVALSASGRRLEVMPGMTVTLDIRTGTRTALSYFLSPIRRTLSEAFTEP